jgi:ABC-type lipoprotein release transport system permease subunit
MQSILYGVSTVDPLAVGVGALLLMLSAFLACYVPAHGATRVQPMVAFRQA